MKSQEYEKSFGITLLGFFYCLIEVIFLLFLFLYKMETYSSISGFVGDHEVVCYVTAKERKLLYANSKLYVNNQLEEYEIKEDKGVVLEQDGKSYYQMLLYFPIPKKYKLNDVISLSVQKNNSRMINVFQKIWEGD